MMGFRVRREFLNCLLEKRFGLLKVLVLNGLDSFVIELFCGMAESRHGPKCNEEDK
jgi:hypothetical protein